MSFRDLIFIKEEVPGSAQSTTSTKQVPVKSAPQKSATSFPGSTPVFPGSTPVFPGSEPNFPPVENSYVAPVGNPFLDKILDVYEKGFDKLNQPGYDFFEYYKAVSKAGVNNPQVYSMAFDMAQSMDGSVTKDSLVRQAEYYIGELEKVYNEFNNNGRGKIQGLTQKKTTESTALSQDIASLQQQVAQMNVQISLKQSALGDIDHRYQPEIDEVAQKLAANDLVKNKFVSNINIVKMNINNNLK